MKLCIPPTGQENKGGSGTFRRLWLAWLTEQGISWTDDLDATYDVLFVNAWQTKYPVVYRHKRRLGQLQVVQRVDGAGIDYGRSDGADAGQKAVNHLADLTIFQSDYSRYSTRVKHPIIRQDGPTIYNPVDAEQFTPDGQQADLFPDQSRPKIIAAIWSTNRRKGGWRVPILAQTHPEIDFVFIGDRQGDDLPNLRYIERLPNAELPAAFRSADLFLNLSENDPCPNVVLEAMACGLPVLYVPSGGTPELVGEAGQPFTTDSEFDGALGRILADLSGYQAMARARVVSHFAREIIFPRYWDAIQTAQRRPMPSLPRHWEAWGLTAKVWLQDKVVNWREIFGA